MKIAVAGTGYVGLSIATLLAQHNQVTAIDIIPEKVELINNRKSPVRSNYYKLIFFKGDKGALGKLVPCPHKTYLNNTVTQLFYYIYAVGNGNSHTQRRRCLFK